MPEENMGEVAVRVEQKNNQSQKHKRQRGGDTRAQTVINLKKE